MYEINKEERNEVVDELVKLLPASKRDEARKTVNNLADLFEGQDMNALGLLYRAAEKGKFDEYAYKIQDYYNNYGRFVAVDRRSAARNQNIIILQDIVKKEAEIQSGKRPRTDRFYWPKSVQTLATYLDSVKMELFFADSFKELMG